MFKQVLKRPYYYLFTSFFIMVMFLAVFFTIWLNATQKHPSGNYNWLERQVVSVVNSALIRPAYIVHDFFGIFKFSLLTRGSQIRDLQINYEQLKNAYTILQAENKRLSSIVNYTSKTNNIVATARILSNTNSISSGIFVVSAGRNNGVELGDIVTTEYGLVGKIVKLHDDTAFVLPIKHLSAKTIGQLRSHGGVVLISGHHLKGGVVEYISDTTNLEKGQEIISISDGKSMPSGIKIGTIIDPYEKPMRVQLSVDFATLDYVIIVRNTTSGNTLPYLHHKPLQFPWYEPCNMTPIKD